MTSRVIVAGALGVIGRAAVEHFLGFADCLDSEDGVIALLERMRAERYLP